MAGRDIKRRSYRKVWLVIVCLLCGVVVCSVRFFMKNEGVMEAVKPMARQSPKVKKLEYLADISGEEAGSVLNQGQIDVKNPDRYFTSNMLNESVMQRINGKSYRENKYIYPEDLRYLKLLHYNYDHEIQVGELIVNKRIAEDCIHVFQELFAKEYEIESMRLVDDFWTGDSVDSDTNSIAHNNTSAFNYRVVPGSSHLSNHAKGFAIDVNPLQNPYVKYNSDGSFAADYKDIEKYLDRSSGKPHMITHQDTCYQVFAKYGFTWGGDWNSSKDYQHFQKVKK